MNPGYPAYHGATFLCPFCEGKVQIDASDTPGLIHALPICRQFDTLEPDEFMEAVNNYVASTAYHGARFLCPFCEGKVEIDASDTPGLIHALPICRQFDTLEPDEFMEAVNNYMASTPEERERLDQNRAAWDRKNPLKQ